VIAAFAWGFGAATSLLVGGFISLRWRIGPKALGLIMAFGAGVLLSAVAFELVEEAFRVAANGITVALGMAVGAITFYVGDGLIERAGGGDRKPVGEPDPKAGATQSPLAIVLGIVLDGIPESIVIGLTLLGGSAIDLAVVIAVFLSNVPESIAATTGLRARGWAPTRIMGLWLLVAVVSGAASLAGYVVFGGASGSAVAFVDAFAAGAILTMLADTMMPEAYEHGGKLVGVVTTLGFALAFLIDQLA
jgi:ZIP family zinc transporter